jgi:hypothetical protein
MLHPQEIIDRKKSRILAVGTAARGCRYREVPDQGRNQSFPVVGGKT